MDEPIIVKLNRTKEQEKQRNKMNGLKYKTAEPKLIKTARTPNQNSRTQANKNNRKRRKEGEESAHEDGRMLDDLATRSVECS